MAEEIPEGPNTVVLDEEETEDDIETISLQIRRRKYTAPLVLPEVTERLFQESELAKKADSPFRFMIVSLSQVGVTPCATPTSAPPSIADDRE